jgi:integrase
MSIQMQGCELHMPSSRKRGAGYQITVSCGYDANGKKILKTTTWTPPAGMTEKQTQKELGRQKFIFENEIKSGNVAEGKNIKLTDFCTEYLEIIASTLAPTTLRSYKKTIEQRIIPALGHIKLTDLRPLHVQRFIQMLEEKGQFIDLHYKQWEKRAEKAKKAGKKMPPAPDKKDYLSAASIKRFHAVLQSVLGRALKLGLIAYNPANGEKLDLPHIESPEVQILDEDAAVAVLEALESEPLKYQVMVHMALCLGCRRGELVALHWRNINLETGMVKIEHSAYKLPGEDVKLKDPKNKSSLRNVILPTYCCDLLKIYRSEQTKERLKLGTLWHDDDFIFTTWNGEEINPDTPSKWFPAFLKRKSLSHVKFHALRHSSATLALYNGANIKAVSGRLGHAQLSTTNRYLHLIKAADENIAESFNNLFSKTKMDIKNGRG